MSYVWSSSDIIPLMTSSSTTIDGVTYVASATSFYTGYDPWRAFNHADGAGNSLWLTFDAPTVESPQRLKFYFGGLWVTPGQKYRMVNLSSSAGVGDLNNPRDWLFRASQDDVTWDTLDSQVDITWVVDEVKEFTLPNGTKKYKYIELYITDYNPFSYTYLALAELEVWGSSVALVTDRLVRYRRTRHLGSVSGV